VSGIIQRAFANPPLRGAPDGQARDDSDRGVPLALLASLALAASPLLLPTEEETLGSGLRIVAHSWSDAPNITINLLVPAGAAADPPGRSGLAHLVEHLAFEGSEGAPGNAGDVWIRAAGGQSDASTRHDALLFTSTAPPEALSLALFLESERLGHLTPAAEALANQQAVVANERAESARADQVRAALAPLLWPAGHPYARQVIGRTEELRAATLLDVSTFVRENLVPAGATLVVVGPMPAAEMRAEARRWFGEEGVDGARGAWVPAPEDAARVATVASAPTTPVRGGLRVWVPGDVDRVRLRLAWRTVDRAHPDRVALELAGAVLAAALNDDGVDVNAWAGRYGGELTLAADTTRPAFVLRRMERALYTLVRSGPEADTLARVRTAARGWELRTLQTTGGRAAALVACVERGAAPDCLADEWAAREATGPAAVRAAAARWLTPDGRVLLAVAPSSARHAPLPRLTREPTP